jgi:hypothetical protein
MLINKGLSSGDVVTIKLSSGEEIIAKYIEETAKGHKISKPMVLSITQQGVGMVPYLFTVNPDTEIVVSNNVISVIVNTESDFSKQYLQASTGLQLA